MEQNLADIILPPVSSVIFSLRDSLLQKQIRRANLLFIVLFAKNCTNQIKSNYLNSHGEEAQKKPQAYKEWFPQLDN